MVDRRAFVKETHFDLYIRIFFLTFTLRFQRIGGKSKTVPTVLIADDAHSKIQT